MIKVLIVEDEKIIREGIKKAIEWQKNGFLIVGEAEDGEEAWDMISCLSPDVIITDVQMPFMNGIELQKKVKALGLDVYTVVISGYNDFEYAQAMLNNGVFAYILKPLKADELEKILGDISSDYYYRIKNKMEMGELQKLVQKGKKQSMEYSAYLYLNDLSTQKDMEEALNSVGINSEELYFTVVRIYIRLYDGQTDAEEVKKVFRSCASQRMAFWTVDGKNDYILIVWNTDILSLKEELRKSIGTFQRKFEGNIFCTNNQMARGIEGLKKSAECAETEINEYKKSVKLVELNGCKASDKKQMHRDIIALSEAFVFDSKCNLENSIEHLKIKLCERPMRDNEMHFLISSLIYRLFKVIGCSDIDRTMIIDDEPEKIVSSIMSNDAEKRMEALEKWLLFVRGKIDLVQSRGILKVSFRAKKYIEEHYMEEELSLCDVAHYVNMSVSYFSAVFKKDEGVSFSEYLTGIRLEKARQLLTMSNYRAYEIAIMVGYANATYFSTIFKRKYGVSPTEFRKAIKTPSTGS